MRIDIEILQQSIPMLVPVVPALVLAAVVLSLLARGRRKLGQRHPQHLYEINLVTSVVKWVILVIILMVLLESLNVPLGNIWTAVSAMLALVAIGFVAVWSILSHMTAAMVLFLQRPFRTGQVLELADDDYRGKIVKTGLFWTVIEDTEGGFSRIPNNLLFQRRFRVTDPSV